MPARRESIRGNPGQELCIHSTVSPSPPRHTQKAKMPAMARADHLHVWRQGDAIKHPRFNPRIVGGKEYMTGNGNARHQGGCTALAVVVERIPKTTLGRGVAVVEGVERQLYRELGAW